MQIWIYEYANVVCLSDKRLIRQKSLFCFGFFPPPLFSNEWRNKQLSFKKKKKEERKRKNNLWLPQIGASDTRSEPLGSSYRPVEAQNPAKFRCASLGRRGWEVRGAATPSRFSADSPCEGRSADGIDQEQQDPQNCPLQDPTNKWKS